ncbi:MAG: hypothetical protein JO079_14005 [Frankiaceae bacterium]|nr:hypothetical protein [Frankiaceae bacterium]MBV9368650.1 hypothetical protein [Frankiales bacterium]
MRLAADGTGTIHASDGPYGESDRLTLVRYRNPDRLLVTVSSVSYVDRTSNKPIPRPTDKCSLADGFSVAGDQYLLRFAAPHLLIESVLVSHVAPNNLDNGNPYWCGVGLAARYQDRCGA